MTSLVDALVKKLGDWWPVALIASGMPFTLVTWVAWTMWSPWRGPWSGIVSLSAFERRLPTELAAHTSSATSTAAFVMLALTAAATSAFVAVGIGLCAQALWFTPWPAAFRGWEARRIARRADAWEVAQTEYENAATGRREGEAILKALRRNSICLVRPTRATWMGDRIAAVSTRLRRLYEFDLEYGWHRVWLVLDNDARAELTATRGRLDAAATLAGWAVLYLLLAVCWPPSIVIAVALGYLAWKRARSNVDLLAHQMESAVDLTLRELADRTGRASDPGISDSVIGTDLRQIFRKGV